jgi:hypothetical protein
MTPNGVFLEQTQTDNLPPEDTIARFVSLLNAVAAELAIPSAALKVLFSERSISCY